jgi:hypothetical protein
MGWGHCAALFWTQRICAISGETTEALHILYASVALYEGYMEGMFYMDYICYISKI